jgi:predicted glycosyltransferase
LFYVQHLLGIGHLARASRVAGALAADGFAVTVVTGGLPIPGFPGPGVDQVELPAVAAASEGFSGLVDATGSPIDESFRSRRTALLLDALTRVRPDVVIVEAFPFGRRQMRFELLPLLDAVAAMRPRPKLITSVRDILQARVKPGRNEETVALLNQHFDLVMMHGDPAFARLEDTFPLAAAITVPVAYTGLVAGPQPAPAAHTFDVLISAGGGAAGATLVAAAVEAARIAGGRGRWGLVTGPNLPQAAFDDAVRSAPERLEVLRFRTDFPGLLRNAQLSVSQAGYNTVCDIFRAGCRALLVPFAAGGETEQSERAARLESLGLAQTMPEDALDGATLAGAIERALAEPLPSPAALDLDGAAGSARLLRRLLA